MLFLHSLLYISLYRNSGPASEMAGSTNLVVPLVMWGKAAPGHCVSCLYLLRDQRTMVTGSYDGQLIIWELDSPETWSFTPRHMLIGHTAAVR